MWKEIEIERIKNIIIINIIMYISIYNYYLYNNNNIEYQFRYKLWNYSIGLDNISLSLILLTTLIFPLILYSKERYKNLRKDKYIIIMEIIIIIILLNIDLIIFYITYELIIIPILIYIINIGYKKTRYLGSNKILIYTLLSSILMILIILYMKLYIGTTNNELLSYYYSYNNNNKILYLIWFGLFINFMIKVPIFPFHIWLPYAHTEATTTGSMILAAILIKLGIFGIYKFNIEPFRLNYSIINYFKPLIQLLIIISIILSLITIYRLVDMKKIIAYSSIVHMNIGIYGLININKISIIGSLINNITHGIISTALFYIIGLLYYRYNNKLIFYYKGLFNILPLFSLFSILFLFFNVGIPSSSSFISEFYILYGNLYNNYYLTLIMGILIIISGYYNLLLLIKINYGKLTPYIKSFNDLNLNEFIILFFLLFFNLLFGFFPYPLFNFFLFI